MLLIDHQIGLFTGDRATVNAWDGPRFVEAVKGTKRNHLIIVNLPFEVCASLPAISAKAEGY